MESRGSTLNLAQLTQYFAGASKPPSQFLVGIENEKLWVQSDHGDPVSYEGDRGIRAFLQAMCRRFGWEPISEGDNIIGLVRGETRITLEPGGQHELSGKPYPNLHMVYEEFSEHRRELSKLAQEFGVSFLGLGARPLGSVEQVPWVPKRRYQVMSRFLKEKGSLGHDMMKQTATVQTAVDYQDEEDAMEKLKVAMGVTSLVTAMFANSPISEGRLNGYMTYRSHIWTDTDPDRCGLLRGTLENGYSFQEYARFAASVPMIFIEREGHYIPAGGIPFFRYMEEGYEGCQATLEDWGVHLTTIFTEVRLKDYIELRGADSQRPGLVMAVPALWKGILYDSAARAAAWDLVRTWTWEERLELHRDICRQALMARIRGKQVLDLTNELLRISLEGLRRQAVVDEKDHDERIYLDPLSHLISERGACPALILAQLWESEWRRDPNRLIEYCRFTEKGEDGDFS
ncbi:MAG TPA: glutamate-cysteine ligase family protein [bacterium]|nr:glutamate-cysteine ligase family protein [bacterium]